MQKNAIKKYIFKPDSVLSQTEEITEPSEKVIRKIFPKNLNYLFKVLILTQLI